MYSKRCVHLFLHPTWKTFTKSQFWQTYVLTIWTNHEPSPAGFISLSLCELMGSIMTLPFLTPLSYGVLQSPCFFGSALGPSLHPLSFGSALGPFLHSPVNLRSSFPTAISWNPHQGSQILSDSHYYGLPNSALSNYVQQSLLVFPHPRLQHPSFIYTIRVKTCVDIYPPAPSVFRSSSEQW